MQEWEWSGKYPEQPEILRYLNHVADRFDLRRNIAFDTRVTSAHCDEAGGRWTSRPTPATASAPSSSSPPSAACRRPGAEHPGPRHVRGRLVPHRAWPHDGVDFTGKRVGVVGTGSSGVQAIPRIAEQAAHLTVFQRTRSTPSRPATAPSTRRSSTRSRPATTTSTSSAAVGRRPAVHADGALGAGGQRGGARRGLRGGVAGGRVPVPDRHVQRHRPRSAGQRHGLGVHPQQDPRDDEGPDGGREAGARRPSVHVEAAADRHQLLRDVQPRQRHARRHPPRPDPGDHADRASARPTASTSSTSSCSPPASMP